MMKWEDKCKEYVLVWLIIAAIIGLGESLMEKVN